MGWSPTMRGSSWTSWQRPCRQPRASGRRDRAKMSEADRQTDRVEQLLAALRDDNEALRDHAVASLGQMGVEALPRLIGLLADEDMVIREAGTSAIVRIGPAAVGPLVEALDDDEWAVREQAASGLGAASARSSKRSRMRTGWSGEMRPNPWPD